MSNGPISPQPVTEAGPDFLPAYLSNGVIGLRVREIPLLNGVAVLNGLAGEHPVKIESLWIRGRRARLTARHGKPSARIEFHDEAGSAA